MHDEPVVAGDVSDLDLVERCQRGDMHAFDVLVTRYRGKAYAMIFNMVRNEQDAWDLAQEGFVKAWKSIGKFRGQSAFFTWLYRIMMNLAIDWSRKRHIRGEAEFDDAVEPRSIEPGAPTAPRPAALPALNLQNQEIRARIDEALTRLSLDHRAVITLREIDGLDYQEIATTLGISMGTVMSRLFYARKKMQGMLKDVYESI